MDARVRVFWNETPVYKESSCWKPVCSKKTPGSTARQRHLSSCVQHRSGSEEQPVRARPPKRQRSGMMIRKESVTGGSL